MEKKQANFYYIALSENHLDRMDREKPLFVVLSASVGDAELFIRLQRNSDLIDKSEWALPSAAEYDFESNRVGLQKVAEVEATDLEMCMSESKNSDVYQSTASQGEKAECSIVIGAYGSSEGPEVIEYNLVAFINVQHITSDQVVEASVREHEYRYFIYEVTCDDCTVVIGVQSFAGGNPDLYINIGEQNLPDKSSYQIKSTTESSEALMLTKDHRFFRVNQIDSMRGTYTIGVYGKTRAAFLLSAAQNERGFTKLVEGMGLE